MIFSHKTPIDVFITVKTLSDDCSWGYAIYLNCSHYPRRVSTDNDNLLISRWAPHGQGEFRQVTDSDTISADHISNSDKSSPSGKKIYTGESKADNDQTKL